MKIAIEFIGVLIFTTKTQGCGTRASFQGSQIVREPKGLQKNGMRIWKTGGTVNERCSEHDARSRNTL